MLQGTFVIHNSIDVNNLAPFAEIAGDLDIDAPGMTSISLPNLCKVDGFIATTGGNAPALKTLSLPALEYAGTVALSSGLDSLTTLDVSSLQSVPQSFKVVAPSLTSLTLTSLTSTPTIDVHDDGGMLSIPNFKGPATITIGGAGGLPNAVLFDISLASLTSGNLVISGDAASLDIPVFASGDFVFTGTIPSLDFSSLVTINTSFIVNLVNAGIPITLPNTTTVNGVGGNFSINKATTVSAPKLTTMGAALLGVTATGDVDMPVLSSVSFCQTYSPTDTTIKTTGNIKLPALTTLGCNFGVFDAKGTIDMHSLTGAKDLTVASTSSVNLSALTTATTLRVRGTTLSTLSLPVLKSADSIFGTFNCVGNPDNNTLLSAIVAPVYKSGSVTFFGNPTMPKCRADAIIAQVGSGNEACALAAGPCP